MSMPANSSRGPEGYMMVVDPYIFSGRLIVVVFLSFTLQSKEKIETFLTYDVSQDLKHLTL